jgi:nucleotide-binding universal stress UspA family protein
VGFEIGRDGPGLLLVGVDGTPTSVNALAWASGMARREGSELVVVEVRSIISTAAAAAGAAGVVLEPGQPAPSAVLTERAVAALDELLAGRWRVEVRTGDPAEELEGLARELRADAIVVGRSRNPGRHVLGSVSGRLVRHARHPVIVVP